MFPNQHFFFFFCNSLSPILLLQWKWCNFYQILVPVFVIIAKVHANCREVTNCPPRSFPPRWYSSTDTHNLKIIKMNLREKPNVQRLWLAKKKKGGGARRGLGLFPRCTEWKTQSSPWGHKPYELRLKWILQCPAHVRFSWVHRLQTIVRINNVHGTRKFRLASQFCFHQLLTEIYHFLELWT